MELRRLPHTNFTMLLTFALALQVQDTKKIVEAEGRKCLLIRGDLEAEAHCLEVVQKTVDEYGRIDVLINNAAFQVGILLRESTV